ncbi:uncharacterized protein LOC115742602 isoform X2 [Rhodamnia argentea]|uniref:Uncharacterized protein LOC115742602 isoform X2 n=1 Tax=Rhodamnia argentea TaxID=178133 RepID=A0A8B8PDF7_9MYRT|nr:uncharacterized protein LOC115742602 isoform X2 [Rhodamnia argentea]XP_030532851.2 uncharacterized protein LOC115742602 isoform X2 [Rhodamnia argentea]XP_048127862.1 uncharacterized protein LOC115742602 isoform X2 [Rhodamnia argentea]
MSLSVASNISLDPNRRDGFIAADVERSSVVLTGKAFADIVGVRKALTAVSEPIICTSGGLPLSARLLVHGYNVVLLFAPEAAIQSWKDQLVSADAGLLSLLKALHYSFQLDILMAPMYTRYQLPLSWHLLTVLALSLLCPS